MGVNVAISVVMGKGVENSQAELQTLTFTAEIKT